MKKTRTSAAVQRWGKWALTLLLACALLAGLALSAAARGSYQGEVIDPAVPKPTVFVRGNLVLDKPGGKPTGFYELALCVRSGRTIVGPDPADWTTVKELTEDQYKTALTAIGNNTAPAGITGDSYTLTYYPFTSVGGVMNINTDVLTAVNWQIQNVTYDEYDAVNSAYKSEIAAGLTGSYPYPRGIDTDPTVQGYDTLGLSRADAFPDITTANILLGDPGVAIDVEADPRMVEATGQVDHYDAVGSTALLTLTASAPDNAPVVLKEETALVVARFSYDLKRFPTVKVNDKDWARDLRNEATGDSGDVGFWLGWDKTTAITDGNNATLALKTPLTWLGESVDNRPTGGILYDFETSDYMAARTRVNQTAWVHMVTDEQPLTQRDTYFYYYLGAEDNQNSGQKTQKVVVGGEPTAVPGITMPKTEGEKVLTEGTEENPVPTPAPATPTPTASPAPSPTPTPTQAGYTYFKNLLRLKDETLVVKLVNDETFKKPSGGFGGNTILFYDWDDKLIGSLIVEDGDVREAVNNYVEQNFVHPDLRTSTVLAGSELNGTLPDFTTTPAAGSDAEKYGKLITSLDREYTYRGEQDSVYGGGAGSVTYPEKGQPGYDETKAGSSYPLTNKLDYAFYRRLNTVTTVDTEDTATGKSWTEEYYKVDDLTADPDAALYPWIRGWAVVADPDNHTLSTKSDWPLMVDSDKLESTWTTFGTGELADQAPGGGNVLTGFATPVTVTPPATNPTVTYPGGLSADWSADPLYQTPTDYAYQTSSADANGYLRFADFSDIDAMFLPGQNVLVVKAVYEPGSSLDSLGNYTIVEGSLDMRRYSTTASTENGVYSFAYQYQRGWDTTGLTPYRGVRRVRNPAVKTGFTFDAKSVDETIDLSKQGMFYMQNLAAGDGNILDVDLTSGGPLWDMAYTLVERYGTNFANGANRSGTSDWGAEIKKNFLYDDTDPKYDERQGTDGFVTQLTLTTLLEEASKAARNEDNILATHCTAATLQDLNFKAAAGDPPVEYDFFTAGNVEGYLRDLVQRLYDDSVSIDPKTGNVTLTWHQVQRHILMCEAAGGTAVSGIYSGGVLMTDAACAGFGWCRLDDCAADVKMEINSVNDVLKALYILQKEGSASVDGKKAYEALYGDGTAGSTGVTAATLLGYGFRRHADGVPYDTTAGDAAVKTAILGDLNAAVTALAPTMGTDPDWSTVTWDQIQTEIVKHNTITPPATMTFWWKPEAGKPNGTPPSITTWEELWKYSINATLGADTDEDGQPNADAIVPDAFDGFDQAALDALVSEKPGTSTATNLGWFRTGVIDPLDDEHAMEFTPDDFKTAWQNALKVLTTAPGPYNGRDVSTATWEEFQWALINGTYRPHADIFNDPNVDYWWKDGGKPALTFEKLRPTLMSHVLQGPTGGDAAALITNIDAVTDQLRFRKDEYGSEFASRDEFLMILKDALSKYMDIGNPMDYVNATWDGFDNLTWEELQWLLIHYNDINFGDTVPTEENSWTDPGGKFDPVNPAADFWWKDPSGTPPQTPIQVGTIGALLQGAKWTWETPPVNDQALMGSDLLDQIKALHLRGRYGVEFTSDTAFRAALKTAYEQLLVANGGGYTVDTVTKATWKEVQYALIYGAYKQDAAIDEDFWWQDGGRPDIVDIESLLKAAWYANQGATDALDRLVESLDGLDAAIAAKSMSLDMLNDSKADPGPLLRLRQDDQGTKWAQLAQAKAAMLRAASALAPNTPGAPYTFATLGSATWEEVQYAVINGAYKSAADIAADTNIDYWWKDQDTKPGSGPAAKPLGLDWDTFMQKVSLNYYGSRTEKAQLKTFLNNGNVSALNDDLLLRNGPTDADTFTAYTEFTGKLTKIKNNILAKTSTDTAGNIIHDSTAADKTQCVKMTWAQFQWALLNCDSAWPSGTPIPSDAELMKDTNYPWRFEAAARTPVEKADPADWATFMQNVSLNYYGSRTQKALLKTYLDGGGVTKLNGDLLLRNGATDADAFTAYTEFTGKLTKIKSNILSKTSTDTAGNTIHDSTAADKTTCVNLTWWQFQWALLHCDSAWPAGTPIPSDADLKADLANNNYTWKFEDGYTGVDPAAGTSALDMGEVDGDIPPEEETPQAQREALLEEIARKERELEALREQLAALDETAEEETPQGEEANASSSTDSTLISQPSADSFPLPGGSLKDPERQPDTDTSDTDTDTPAPDDPTPDEPAQNDPTPDEPSSEDVGRDDPARQPGTDTPDTDRGEVEEVPQGEDARVVAVMMNATTDLCGSPSLDPPPGCLAALMPPDWRRRTD